MTAVDLPTIFKEKFPQAAPRVSSDCPAFNVPGDQIIAVLQHLRDEAGFDFLVDLTAVDWDKASPRFTVVYHLYSSTQHTYVRLATDSPSDTEPTAPTATGLWPGADWHERECFDMFGIKFTGHPDLRRILMWDGYPYFPLRKEFPLAGHETVLPDIEVVAETGTKVLPAPMAGGPFVAAQEPTLGDAEPRAKDESWHEHNEKPAR
jgi:NADH-quinone oxidoreductase subunit C